MFCNTLAFVCLLLSASPLLAQQNDGRVLAIVGGTVIDGSDEDPLPNSVLLIRGQKIACVGDAKACPIPEGADRIDATGRWLIPGLIDTHVHLPWDGKRIAAAGIEGPVPGLADWLRWYLANGVTTIRDASRGGKERETVALRESSELAAIPWPRIYVSGRIDPRNVRRYAASDVRDLTRMLIELGVDGIKVRNGLSLEEVVSVIEEAAGHGIPVYGHTAYIPKSGIGLLDYTDEAVRSGLRGVMHLDFLAPPDKTMMPAEPSEPLGEENWVDWWLSMSSRWLYADTVRLHARMLLMIRQGAWLEPTLIATDFWGNPEPYDEYAIEPMLEATYRDMKGGALPFSEEQRIQYFEAFRRAQDFVGTFHRAGGMLITGTDNLPIFGVGIHDEMRLLVESGLSPKSALQAATRNAAQALKWHERIGTLKVGKIADLLILSADPLDDINNTRAIWRVIKGGKVYDPAELRSGFLRHQGTHQERP